MATRLTMSYCTCHLTGYIVYMQQDNIEIPFGNGK